MQTPRRQPSPKRQASPATRAATPARTTSAPTPSRNGSTVRRAYVVVDENEDVAEARVTSLRFQQAVPTAVMIFVLLLSYILMSAAVILIIVTLLLPSLYEVSSPIAGKWTDENGTTTVLVPAHEADISLFEVCYDTDSCRSRQDSTLLPLSNEVISWYTGGVLPTEVHQVVDQVMTVALDFSLGRGVSCGNTLSSGKVYRGLVVAGLCLAGLCGLLGVIPGGMLLSRMALRRDQTVALSKTNSLEFVNEERRRAKSESLLLAIATAFYFAAVVGMAVAMVLFYRLEEDILRCTGDSFCDSYLKGIRSMYSSELVTNFTTSDAQPTCGSGPGLICFWVALLLVGLAFLLIVIFLVMYVCSRRRQRIYEECKQSALRISLQDKQQEEPQPRELFDAVHSAPPPIVSPPRAITIRPLTPNPASPEKLLQERMHICIEEEYFRRQRLMKEESCEMYGKVHYPLRKLWRCFRVSTLHEWSLDWFFGPILDAHLEETYYRQELMRRWFAGVCKILSQQARFVGHAFPTPNLNDVLATASHYRNFPTTKPFAEREKEWMQIVDSPTRRAMPLHRQPSLDSVEISSNSSSDMGYSPRERPQPQRAPLSTVRRDPPPFRMTYEELIRRATTKRPFHRFSPATASHSRLASPATPRPGMGVSYEAHNSSFGAPRTSSVPSSRSRSAVTDEIEAADAASRAYAASLYRSSQRPMYDHGYDPRHDASVDFRSALDRGRTPTSAGPRTPWGDQSSVMLDSSSFHATPTDWRRGGQQQAPPMGRWGEEVVRERLSHLNRYQEDDIR